MANTIGQKNSVIKSMGLQENKQESIRRNLPPLPTDNESVKCNYCSSLIPVNDDTVQARILEQCRRFNICYTCWDTMFGKNGYLDRNTYKLDR